MTYPGDLEFKPTYGGLRLADDFGEILVREWSAISSHGGSLGGDEPLELVGVADPVELVAVEGPEVVFIVQEVLSGGFGMAVDQPLMVLAGLRRGNVRILLGVEPSQHPNS